MDLTTLLIILLLVVVLGGGGYYGRRGWFQAPHLPIRYRKFPRLRDRRLRAWIHTSSPCVVDDSPSAKAAASESDSAVTR